MFTDNVVWSYMWNKGMSTAKHLFLLVVELKKEAHLHEVYVRSCHVSGDRMIVIGMDRVSRSDNDAGMSLGYDIREFVPLHLSV